MFQLVPSQTSASVKNLKGLPIEKPTAVHSRTLGHETPNNWANAAPSGFGVGWISHREPVQRSARFVTMPELSTEAPTAVHALAAGAQETPFKTLATAPVGLGEA